MSPFTNYLLPSLLVLASACSYQDYVEAPPINEQIMVGAGEAEGPQEVQCEGPDDELELLGSLCGSSTLRYGWRNTDAPGAGMATAVGQEGDAQLMIFNEIDRSPDHLENVAADVAYAAYVVLETSSTPSSSVDHLDQWSGGEAVSGGSIITESVRFAACDGGTWVASGTFLWRNTEITLSWDTASGC